MEYMQGKLRQPVGGQVISSILPSVSTLHLVEDYG